MMLCGWGIKAEWLIPFVDKRVATVDPSLTRAIPERFRDEYRTHYKVLYKCPVYLLTLSYMCNGRYNKLV